MVLANAATARSMINMCVKTDPCSAFPKLKICLKLSNIQIRNYLLRSEIKVGPIKSIYPIGKNSSGRVRALMIKHELGSTRITGKKFRQMIGYNHLPSLLFQIEEIQEKKEEEEEETIKKKKKKKEKNYDLEKTFNLIEGESKIVFIVDLRASKKLVKAALKTLYEIESEEVNTIRSIRGKKAIVRFASAEKARELATSLGLV